jgi:diacylglycerol kinase (ATP)
MKRGFYLSIVFFLVFFAACEAALFAFSPAVRSDYRFLGTLPGYLSIVFFLARSNPDSPFHRLFNATRNSLRGLVDGFATEPALREELVLLAVAVPLGFFLAPSAAWYVAMIGAVLVILAVEFLNTAIEKLSDHVTRELHNDIRRVKDFGSAAVFCALNLAGLVWLAAIAVRLGLLKPA